MGADTARPIASETMLQLVRTLTAGTLAVVARAGVLVPAMAALWAVRRHCRPASSDPPDESHGAKPRDAGPLERPRSATTMTK